jgi:peroxiredoxin
MKIATTILVLTVIAAVCAPLRLGAQDAATEYKAIMQELTAKQKTASPNGLVEAAEKKLGAFIEAYPGSSEAASAHLVLANIYSSLGRNDEAVKHVDAYMQAGVEKSRDDEIKSRFILSNIHIANDDFDKAEKLYREMLEINAGKDKRAENYITMQLGRLGALKKLKIGAPAIPFAAKATDGKEINLEDYKGKVVLIDFWASWCQPCKREMPNVKRVYAEFHDKGFEIIGISLDNNESAFRGYVTSQNLIWPQVFDGRGWQSEIGRIYAVNSIPATFLLDRDGKIRHKNLRGHELRSAVEKLISADPTGAAD